MKGCEAHHGEPIAGAATGGSYQSPGMDQVPAGGGISHTACAVPKTCIVANLVVLAASLQQLSIEYHMRDDDKAAQQCVNKQTQASP